jgi:hypothetical protein
MHNLFVFLVVWVVAYVAYRAMLLLLDVTAVRIVPSEQDDKGPMLVIERGKQPGRTEARIWYALSVGEYTGFYRSSHRGVTFSSRHIGCGWLLLGIYDWRI